LDTNQWFGNIPMLSREATHAAEVIDLSQGLSLHDLAVSTAFGSHIPTDQVLAAVLELAMKKLIRWTREFDYGNAPELIGANIEADLAWVKASRFDPRALPTKENPTLFIEPTPALARNLDEALEVHGSILSGPAAPGAPPNGGPAKPLGNSGVRGGPPSVS
jgi:hypothetical protein